MATKISWTKKSKANLKHIYSYIAADSEIYAQRFVANLIESIEKQLNEFPLSGRIVPEFTDSSLSYLREIIFKGYRIIYSTNNLIIQITIIAIVNGRMNLNIQSKNLH